MKKWTHQIKANFIFRKMTEEVQMLYIKNWKFVCLYLKLHNCYPGDDALKIIEAASNLLVAHGYPRQAGQSFDQHWIVNANNASQIVVKKQQPHNQQVLPPIQAFEEHKNNPIVQLDIQIEAQEKVIQALRDERERLKKQAELDLESQELYRQQIALYRSPDFTKTREWKNLRMKVLTERGAICECCGASAAITQAIINVDHIKPRLYYPELALEESNLQVLCQDCNAGKGNAYSKDWRKK